MRPCTLQKCLTPSLFLLMSQGARWCRSIGVVLGQCQAGVLSAGRFVSRAANFRAFEPICGPGRGRAAVARARVAVERRPEQTACAPPTAKLARVRSRSWPWRLTMPLAMPWTSRTVATRAASACSSLADDVLHCLAGRRGCASSVLGRGRGRRRRSAVGAAGSGRGWERPGRGVDVRKCDICMERCRGRAQQHP